MGLVGHGAGRPKILTRVVDFFIEVPGRVAVKDRPAEGNVRLRMAVSANRHVPAGHYELKLIASRLTEYGDALLSSPILPARVVLELLHQFTVPVRLDD